MLTERFVNDALASHLLSRAAFHPFATADERGPWEGLAPELRARYLSTGERYLGFDYPMLPATRFLDYARNGNRSRYEALHFARRHALSALVLAECVEGQGRFLDDIANGVWCLCEESSWIVPAHNYLSRQRPIPPLPDAADPDIDLFAGETAGLLAWTYYLLGPQLAAITPLLPARIEREMAARIFEPFLARDDFWWMGFTPKWVNNWTPWVNSNVLTAVALVEADPARRTAAVAKALRSLDVFLAAYPADGGCDEGPSYWGHAGASLFDCLEVLYWLSDGAINVYDAPLVNEIGRFIYRAHIHETWYINFADGSARVRPPADLLYRYGQRIGDEKLARLGAHIARSAQQPAEIRLPDNLLRELPAAFNHAALHAAPAEPPYERDVWLPDTQVMVAREHPAPRGLYLAAKGGHNGESHNHNDVGHFIVYADGQPVLIDAGVETYTAKTFSDSRYDIWTMQSAYHNLPTIGGVQQAPGHAYRPAQVAYTQDEASAALTLDIAPAYPAAAGVESWRRTCRLQRGAQPRVEVTDAFRLREATDITMSLLTCCTPEVVGPGTLQLSDGERRVRVEYDPQLTPQIEYLAIDDPRMAGSWGDHLYRVVLSAPPTQEGCWRLIVTQAS